MKKQLLLLASAMLACCVANAQYVSTPMSYTNVCYTAMSPNGKFAAGSDPYTGNVSVLNLQTKTKKTIKIQDENTEWYELGTGANTVSNDGTVLISTTYDGTAAYIQNGKIHYLPVPKGYSSALSNAITPDGSRIAGSIGMVMTDEAEEVMQRPVVWNRQANGTYSDPVLLPYPKKDLTGRLPQYILVDGMSEDGKTLACNIVDYAGMMPQPMVMTEDEAGEWTCKPLAMELLNPNNVVVPEYPGSSPNVALYMSLDEIYAYNDAVARANSLVQPHPKDFMTPENRAAYEKAAEGYSYVNVMDYISEEEYALYLAALDQYYIDLYPKPVDYMSAEHRENYETDYAKWDALYTVFNNAFQSMLDDGVIFEMNDLVLSQNGRYYAIAGSRYDETANMDMIKVYVFDLETGECRVKGVEGLSVLAPIYVTNDGRLLAAKPATRRDNTASAYFAPGLDSDFAPLQDVVKEKDADLYNWMEGKMLHKVWIWDDDIEEDVQIDAWITGTPCCDADMKTVTNWALNTWNSSTSSVYYIYSYVMPMGTAISTGIEEVGAAQSPLAVAMDSNGNIRLSGKAAVTVYDINGRMVYTAKEQATEFSTGLPHGTYIVKAVNGASSAVLKVLI